MAGLGECNAPLRSAVERISSIMLSVIGRTALKLPKKHTTFPLIRALSNKPSGPLRENIWTIPNVLTMTRLAAAPCIGYLVVQESYKMALGLMVYASVTDFIDGYLARHYNSKTVLGSIADPAADKALMVTLSACLTYSGAVPLWCGITILGRDALLALSALVIRYRTLPPPKTFYRFWDMTLPSVSVKPTTISKWNTFFQMIYLGVCIANPVFPIFNATLMTAMAGLVTATTMWSGLSYIFSKNVLKVVR